MEGSFLLGSALYHQNFSIAYSNFKLENTIHNQGPYQPGGR